MSVLKKSSMREQCYEVIKEKILRQEYNLGEFINIVSLSNELAVSNTPIREALSQLEADGLVTSSLNSKTRVITLSDSSYREMTQTINILLCGAYDLCVKENKLELLLYLLKNSLSAQKELLDKKDYHGFIHASIAFDKCILDALGNARLQSVFGGLSNVLFLMVRENHQKDDRQRDLNIREHEMIIDSIKANDHSEVKQLLNLHYNKTIAGVAPMNP